jgi:hypothetical protein
MKVILAGCVAAKRSEPAPAKDLYVSPLWRKRRAHAEASGCLWAIVSAQHGFVRPDELLEPYEKRLTPRDVKPLAELMREPLFTWLAAAIDEPDELYDLRLEVHAGAYYVQAVQAAASWYRSFPQLWPDRSRRLELQVDAPLAGLGIGEQLRWYGERLDPQLSLESP